MPAASRLAPWTGRRLTLPRSGDALATDTRAQLARLNDLHRASLIAPAGGRTVMTRGVAGLNEALLVEALRGVATFSAFTPDNDPWGEHDCARVTLSDGTRVIWKIDYYADARCEFGAEEPAVACYRVLTIMLAEEY